MRKFNLSDLGCYASDTQFDRDEYKDGDQYVIETLAYMAKKVLRISDHDFDSHTRSEYKENLAILRDREGEGELERDARWAYFDVQLAFDILNTACEDEVMFDFFDGDLLLVKAKMADDDPDHYLYPECRDHVYDTQVW
jgi:hypothetical protein